MAFHAAKYQQRDGWAHSDLLRLAHPKGASDLQSVVFRWMMGKELSEEDYRKFAILDGYRKVHAATTAKEVAKLVEEYQLPREVVPTQWLTSRDVWDALLVTMPVGAMIRNLGKMGSLGLLDDLTDTQAFVESKLLYGPGLKKARVHPMAIFVAQLVYGQGRGVKGSLNWPVRARIQDALNEAFVLSFEYVEPTNKKLIVAVDESGSMSSPIANPNIQLRAYNAAVAMAYIIARTEPNIHVIGFDTEVRNFSMSGKQRLQDVLSRSNSGGGTNCSLPFSYARNYGVEVDGIVLLTDSESWAGDEHVFQAADRYRRERNADMRFVTVQMTANSTMLRDPLDNLKSLEVVGFDTTVPVLMSDFLGGKF
jgi:60 kDa SS-A/Ro ribonucleoprotein